MMELVLLVVGFVLGHVPRWLDRKRELRTHWRAIHAEMILLKEKLETLLKDKVRAPLYRLPVVAYETSFPILLAEGAVTEEEIKTIGRCFNLVQDINRGIDNATELYKTGSDKLEKEYKRNCLKVKALLIGNAGQESVFEPARVIIDAKKELSWWNY
jgi:hypothetical protein